MVTVKDAIHGNIQFSELETELLDSAQLQRLRNIKQLGFSYLVYPSATHTRFEHSIGAFHLAGRLGERLGLSRENLQTIKIAALLHDIGHGPFSHSAEDAIRSRFGKHFSHEKNTYHLIENSEISDAIKKFGFSPKEIVKILSGREQPLSDMISSDIDVDRMDYLFRDSYSSGALYGVIDIDRTIDTLTVKNKSLIFSEKGISSAESFARARHLMYPAVYEHHTTRVANSMFSFAVADCLENSVFSIKEFISMDDIGAISTIRNLGNFAGGLMRRILHRNLYKRAAVFNKNDLGKNFSKLLWLKSKDILKLEKEIIQESKLSEGEVLLDVPEPLYTEEAKAKIFMRGKIRKLSDVSPLVKALTTAQWTHWNVAVYCQTQHMKKVEKAANKILL